MPGNFGTTSRVLPAELDITLASLLLLRDVVPRLVARACTSRMEVAGMAERVLRQLVDDLDGSEAVETVRFGYAGRGYEIELSEEHARELDEFLAPYIEHGRRVDGEGERRPGGRRADKGRERAFSDTRTIDTRAIRQWAREQGPQVSDRGRVPADVVEKYEAAH